MPQSWPKISPSRYDKDADGFREALYLGNEGDVGYDVQPEQIFVGRWNVSFKLVEKLVKEAISQVDIFSGTKSHGEGSMTLDGPWTRSFNASECAAEFEFGIRYRGYDCIWYRTTCILERNVGKHGIPFGVRYISQEVLGTVGSITNGVEVWLGYQAQINPGFVVENTSTAEAIAIRINTADGSNHRLESGTVPRLGSSIKEPILMNSIRKQGGGQFPPTAFFEDIAQWRGEARVPILLKWKDSWGRSYVREEVVTWPHVNPWNNPPLIEHGVVWITQP